jgi:hypothetical protein
MRVTSSQGLDPVAGRVDAAANQLTPQPPTTQLVGGP